jgi:hypothetical protein
MEFARIGKRGFEKRTRNAKNDHRRRHRVVRHRLGHVEHIDVAGASLDVTFSVCADVAAAQIERDEKLVDAFADFSFVAREAMGRVGDPADEEVADQIGSRFSRKRRRNGTVDRKEIEERCMVRTPCRKLFGRHKCGRRVVADG